LGPAASEASESKTAETNTFLMLQL
jgi:hypothetical protein